MKKFCVLFVGIVILAIAGISAYGTEEKPVESELGSYYEKAVDQENSETDVVMAVYKEKTVMKSVVEYQRKAQEALAGKPEGTGSSDREIVDDILKNVILQEEAEQRGLMPTEEEVEQYLQETVYAAYAMPEGKEGIDRCLLCQRGDNLRRICGKFARSSAQSVGKGETERGDCGGILSIPWSHL